MLYGAPATGKDTITAALTRRNPRYRLFERLKSGPGRTTGYRMTNDEEITRLIEADQVIWTNERYGARYVIDRPGLSQLFADDFIPVVHAGQPEVIDAVKAAMPQVNWTIVQLVTDLATATARIVDRDTGDSAERLAASMATPRITATATLDTARLTPDEAAEYIEATVRLRTA